MKRTDIIFTACCAALLLPFFLSDTVYNGFLWATKNHPFIMSFFKFGILATAGECIGLRIKTGYYNKPGFGILPRGVTWGFLGMLISANMTIFSNGVPAVLEQLGILPNGEMTYKQMLGMGITQTQSWYHLLASFSVSFFQNTIFAPIFMILHKVSDTHIMNNGGTMRGYFSHVYFSNIFTSLDWYTIWNFLFKKTIPLFWIPAHTITFILPPEWRVLFAALLGVFLGVFMSFATRNKQQAK